MELDAAQVKKKKEAEKEEKSRATSQKGSQKTSMCCVWWSALLHSCNYFLFCTRLITFVLQIAESCREKKSLATLKFSISTNLDQKAERKTFPVSTFLQGKYFFVLQGILFSLLGSCSHYRNLSACPLLYPVQDCNVTLQVRFGELSQVPCIFSKFSKTDLQRHCESGNPPRVPSGVLGPPPLPPKELELELELWFWGRHHVFYKTPILKIGNYQMAFFGVTVNF